MDALRREIYNEKEDGSVGVNWLKVLKYARTILIMLFNFIIGELEKNGDN